MNSRINNIKNLFTIALLLLVFNVSLKAQIVGVGGFIKGTSVEIGLSGAGGFEGTLAVPPVGMHPRGGAGGLFGFVANPQVNAWTTFNGDYFTPGSPENGWGLLIGNSAVGTSLGNNALGPLLQIATTPSLSYSHVLSCYNLDWSASVISGTNNISAKINVFLQETDLYYITTVSLKNNSASIIPNLYYYRNLDPDNNQSIGGTFVTTNLIENQPTAGLCNIACVSATQPSTVAGVGTSYVAFAAVGPDFRVSHGGFSNRNGFNLWNGVGFTQAVGSFTTADEAISLSYKIQNFLPGETRTFKFVTILKAADKLAAIDNLQTVVFPGSIYSAPSACSPANPPDTAKICGPTLVQVSGSNVTAYNWTWSPTTALSSSTTFSTIANPTVQTTYTITGTPSTPCTSTVPVTYTVVVVPTATLVIKPPITVCTGSPIFLTSIYGGLGSTYLWSGPSSFTSTVQNPTIAVSSSLSSGTYTSTLTWPGGCITKVLTTVSVTALPIIIATSPSPSVCLGSSITLSGTGGTSYTWTPGGLIGSSVSVSPTVTTIYTVTGTSGSCNNTSTISITPITGPTITATSNPTIICIGSSATLSAVGATSYTWNPSGLTGTPITVSPTVTTTYTVTGVNGIGCPSTNTVLLTISNPTITATSNPTVLCPGNIAALLGSGAVTYTWFPGGLTGAAIGVAPATTTTYTLSGTTALGCIATTTLNLVVSPNPTVTPALSTTVICAGSTATLSALGATSYTWNPGGLIGSPVSVSPTVTTTYTVTGANASGCTNTTTITLTVNPNPTVTASSNPVVLCIGNTATLTSLGATSYTWNPGGLIGSPVSVSPTVTTTYTVTGENVFGCTNTTTLTLTVSDPTITATASSATICAGTSATLTGSGVSTYTWNPGALTGSTISVTPSVTTTYTVDGNNVFGCLTSQTVVINVNTAPSLSISSTPTVLCAPGSLTLTGSGASTYTWSPIGVTTATAVDNPSVTTTYTLTGSDLIGCSSTETITIAVGSPTIILTGSSLGICIGASATLTASGATSYTWNPVSLTGSTISVSPTVTTTYTVTGIVGTCIGTETINLNVSASPTLVLTASSDTICEGTPTTLTGMGASTYTWNPGGLTGSTVAVTPSVTTTYTVDGDNGLGCIASETIIITVNAAPSLSVSATPTVLCVAGSVTLTGSGAATYTWSPLGVTTSTAVDSPSITTTYTLTGTDLIGCSSNQTITISVGNPTITIVSTPSVLCIGSTATLTASGASSYTWSPLAIVGSTVTDSPLINTTYTVTGDNGFGCVSTNTFVLAVINCSLSTSVFGLTKAVSTPTIINSNAYNVTYTLVATNASTVNLTNFSIIDNLTTTFPLPTTYSVISVPLVTSINSSLTVNSIFDGALQNDLLSPLTSTLLAGKVDTIVFTVQINPNGFMGPFYNSGVGFGTDSLGIVVSDSSNTGFYYDPGLDGDPTNNDTATVLTLSLFSQIGVAKSGSVSTVLDDKTLDVTYVIKVKNLGNDTLKMVQVVDNLTIPLPATYTIKSGPIATGSLTANTLYDGILDPNLLVASSSTLAPGQTETITFVLNITPNEVKSIINIGVGSGVSSLGLAVQDSSNMGGIIDPNGNDIAGEQGENIPTVLELPEVNIFVPDVFTPNGDGKNDLFVIKGITGRVVKLTVFNRWGNLVYEADAYDNTWNGTPNVSALIIGNSKLPQGTYFFIAEFEDGKTKTINGYVVLQY